MTVHYLKVERECSYNSKPENTRQKIYDYDVIIDGQHLATFRRSFQRRRYSLYDLGGHPVIRKLSERTGYHMTAEGGQKDFEPIIKICMEENIIPSKAQIDERAAKQAEALRLEQERILKEQRELEKQERLMLETPMMLDLLRASMVNNTEAWHDQVKKLIARIDLPSKFDKA